MNTTASTTTFPVVTTDGVTFHLPPAVYTQSKMLNDMITATGIENCHSLHEEAQPAPLSITSKDAEMLIEFYTFVATKQEEFAKAKKDNPAAKDEIALITEGSYEERRKIHPWFVEFFQRHSGEEKILSKRAESSFAVMSSYLLCDYALSVSTRYIASKIAACEVTEKMRDYLGVKSDFAPGEEEKLRQSFAVVQPPETKSTTTD